MSDVQIKALELVFLFDCSYLLGPIRNRKTSQPCNVKRPAAVNPSKTTRGCLNSVPRILEIRDERRSNIESASKFDGAGEVDGIPDHQNTEHSIRFWARQHER